MEIEKFLLKQSHSILQTPKFYVRNHLVICHKITLHVLSNDTLIRLAFKFAGRKELEPGLQVNFYPVTTSFAKKALAKTHQLTVHYYVFYSWLKDIF